MSAKTGIHLKGNDNKGNEPAAKKTGGRYTPPVNSPVKLIGRLHRSIGNRAVSRLIQAGVLQARLKVSPPNDVREKEADSMSKEVLSMPGPVSAGRVQREEEEKQEAQGKLIQREEEEKQEAQGKLIQRQEEEKQEARGKLIQRQEEEKQEAQAKSAEVSGDWERRLSVARRGGRPLPDEVRGDMEPRFGADFSNVRVHTGRESGQLSKEINAKAFTVGRNIYFGAGRYNTVSSEGRGLLGHELTHTIQQGAAVRTKRINVGSTVPGIQRDFDPFGYLKKKGEALAGKATKFAKGVVKKVKSVAKMGFSFVLNKIKPYVRKVPRYYLLTVVMGKDPVTGRRVPRTPRTIVKGLLGVARYNKLKKSGAIDSAFNWLNKQIKQLNITPKQIWNLIKQAARTFVGRIFKGFNPLPKLKKILGGSIYRIFRFIRAVGGEIKEFILRGVLKLVGAPVNRIMKILNRGRGVIRRILNNPVRFGLNLAKGVKMGINRFVSNFFTHLKASLKNWLFGTMSKTGIEIPKKLDLKGVFYLVAQVLGLTYQDIRARIVRKLGPTGEKIIGGIEKTVDFVIELKKRGPIVLWEKIQDSLANLKETVIGGIIGWVRNKVILGAVEKILSMLNPAGAMYQVVKAIFNIVMFFINRWNQIKTWAQTVINSVSDIAYGRAAGVGKKIERVMALGLTLVISFLARLLNLSGIARHIRKIIDKVRAPIYKALDKVIGWIIKKGRALFKRGKAAVRRVGKKIKNIIFRKLPFEEADGKTHHLTVNKRGKLVIRSNETIAEDYMEKLKGRIDRSKDKESKRKANRIYQRAKKIIPGINKSLEKVIRADKKTVGKKASEATRRKRIFFKCVKLIWAYLGVREALLKGESTVGEYRMTNYDKMGMNKHHMPAHQLLANFSKFLKGFLNFTGITHKEKKDREKQLEAYSEKFVNLRGYKKADGVSMYIENRRHSVARTSYKSPPTSNAYGPYVELLRRELKKDIADVTKIYRGKKRLPAVSEKEQSKVKGNLYKVKVMNSDKWGLSE